MSFPRLLLAASLLLPSILAQTVTITAPSNNTTTAPGQTVNFTVTLSPASGFTAVALYGPSPLALIGGQAAASTVSFSLDLPADLKSAAYPIVAIGYPAAGPLVLSQPVTLLVGATGVPAALNLNPSRLSFTSIGARLPVMAGGMMPDGTFVDLTVSPSLTWTSSNTAVATVTSDGLVTSVGNGSANIAAKFGSVSATVAANVAAPAAACAYSLDNSSANSPSSGTTLSVNVSTVAACEWSAVSWAPWISVTGGDLGLGSGPVTLAVAGNSGAARTGSVNIAGQNFSIAQAGAIGMTLVPAITGSGVVNGASFVSGGLVPGEIATIFGASLTTATGINLAGSLPLPTQLLNVQVLVNGKAAPVFAVDNLNGQQQINFQVPYEIAGKPTATVQVIDGGTAGNAITLPVTAAQPGIFTYTAGSTNYGAILHANYQLTDSTNPAVAGETVLIYCTGLGAVTLAQADGVAAIGSDAAVLTPAVTIGGIPAIIAYSGLAPGYVGLYQINAVVPFGLASGNQPVVITVYGVQSAMSRLPVQ